MSRVLFRVGRITVYSYTAMQYVGIVLGIFAQKYVAIASGLNPTRVLTATFLLLIPALAGARLFYLLLHWRSYRRDPRRILRQSEGGAAVYGGLMLGVPISIPVLALLRLPFGAYWDTAAFTILIGVMLGRIGCVMNGCCCGRPNSGCFALQLPDRNGEWKRRIPTQILEAAWCLVLLTGAFFLRRKLPFPGAIMLFALFGYGTGRFFLEATREYQDRIGEFSVQRLVSIALVVASLGILAILGPR